MNQVLKLKSSRTVFIEHVFDEEGLPGVNVVISGVTPVNVEEELKMLTLALNNSGLKPMTVLGIMDDVENTIERSSIIDLLTYVTKSVDLA